MGLTEFTTPKTRNGLHYQKRLNRRFGSTPSFDDHPDQGCEFSPKCLSCPLPTCSLDMTTSERVRYRNNLRDAQRLAQVAHLKPAQAAETLDISLRSYHRLAARVGAAFSISGGLS